MKRGIQHSAFSIRGKGNGMPACAGMTQTESVFVLITGLVCGKLGLNRGVMPAKAGIPFCFSKSAKIMRVVVVLVSVMTVLGACAKEEVRGSISQALKRSCQMNDKQCTTQGAADLPAMKGAQQ